VITSTTNANVKYIRSLIAHRPQRLRERCFVLEGVRLVAEALAAGLPLRLVLYAPEQLASTPEGQHLLQHLAGQPGCYEATARVVAAACATVTPQGVVAVAPWPVREPSGGLILVLDAVQDPGNVGTLLRSAVASGVGQVVCSRGTADVYNPKVVRSAMGAHFHLSLHPDMEWEAVAALLQPVPHIYAAVVECSTPYYAVDWREPAALLIGNEAHGLSSAALALATHQITIPLAHPTESLNAAVAGSVILFEVLRQRMAGP
jgi:TrmH family RNA methyltransferase